MEEYSYPWVIFTLHHERYGVATPYIRNMVAMPEVTKIPDAPAYVRGAIKIRGQVTPLIDLRNRLGMGSFLDTIRAQQDMLKQREQEHRNWLLELENSVRENRPFTLATDHHKCKFGQWYDSYTPKSYEEGQFLRKFALPHKRIHEVAIHVEAFIEKGEQDKALQLIADTHDGELAEMIDLFAQFGKIAQEQANKEITIILEADNARTAIAVDSIITVEKLAEGSIEPMPDFGGGSEASLTTRIAKGAKDKELIILLDAGAVIQEANSAR
jgi:purine-binding chemotaxis protein CheW